MTILSSRLLRAGALCLLLAGCSAAPSEQHVTMDVPDLPKVSVTIHVPAEHSQDVERYRDGVVTTLTVLGTWLRPFPDATLDVAPEPTRWWTSAASMTPETAAARAVSRTYISRMIDTSALPPGFVDALVEYSARRGVSKIVDRKYLASYPGRAEARYFGGFVPRDLRVQLSAMSGGDRALLTLGTLERWTGTPTFDAILLEFLAVPKGTRPTLDDFARLASRVSGQDLTWLVDAAVMPGRFDYAVERFESRPESGGLFHTTVTVRRQGDAIFPRAIPVETRFADGASVRDRWDGRSVSETFEYRSPSRAVSTDVDPDRFLLLDEQRANNGITLDPGPARTAANRWSARWMIWLEDALLTYVAFT